MIVVVRRLRLFLDCCSLFNVVCCFFVRVCSSFGVVCCLVCDVVCSLVCVDI